MLMKFDTERQWREAREPNVNTTDLAAMFGLHPYKSRLQLWSEKAGIVDPTDVEDIDPVRWGRRLQNAVGMGICEDMRWIGRDLSLQYHYDPVHRLGASYDLEAICSDRGRLNLEVKIADSFDAESGWTKKEIPVAYEFQIQGQLHEAFKSGDPFDLGVCGAFGRRSSTKLYFREYDKDLGAIFDEEADKFWISIEKNEPPAPDYSVDGPLLERIRKPLIIGDQIILQDDRSKELVAEYIRLRDRRRKWNKFAEVLAGKMDTIEDEILHKMKRNEYAVIGKHKVTAREIEVEEKVTYGFKRRGFSISKTKGR